MNKFIPVLSTVIYICRIPDFQCPKWCPSPIFSRHFCKMLEDAAVASDGLKTLGSRLSESTKNNSVLKFSRLCPTIGFGHRTLICFAASHPISIHFFFPLEFCTSVCVSSLPFHTCSIRSNFCLLHFFQFLHSIPI